MIRATLKSADLSAAMKHSVAQRSGPLPILQHAHVEAREGAVSITTTDMETYCRVTFPAQVEDEGAVAIAADKLSAAALVGGDIRIVHSPDGVRANGKGRNRVSLPHLPAVEFPVPDDESWTPVAVDGAALATALEFVVYAAPSRDIRHYLNGVCVRAGWAVGADGNILARAPIAYDGPTLIIPTKRVATLARALAMPGAKVHVACARDGAARIVRVRYADDGRTVELSTLLIAGNYPDIAPLIEKMADGLTWSAQLDRAALRAAVTIVSPFAPGKAFPIAVITGDDEGLRLTAREETEVTVTPEAQTPHVRGEMRLDMFARMLDVGDTPRVTLGYGPLERGDVFLLRSDDGTAHAIAGCRT